MKGLVTSYLAVGNYSNRLHYSLVIQIYSSYCWRFVGYAFSKWIVAEEAKVVLTGA